MVIRHLPTGAFFSGGFVRRLWHEFYLETAFEAYESGQPDKCKKYALRALINTPPSTLRNRGLVSIFLRSLVGKQNINEFKSLAICPDE
jgi:hypothetical protein